MQKQIKFIYAVLIITIIGAGVTLGLINYGNLKETQNKDKGFIETFKNKKPLLTEFRKPTPLPEKPHIVGAEIEKITVPGCTEDDCLLEIIKNIKGVPDEVIIEINAKLTSWIFDQEDQKSHSDVRDLKQRVVDKNLSTGYAYIDSITNKILYLDQGIMSFSISSELFFDGAAHPSRDPLSYILIDLNSGDYFSIINYDDYHKVIEHFYPNGQDLLAEYRKDPNVNEYCLDDDFDDISWDVYFLPSTKELIFSISYPYASIGPCYGSLNIAIPVADVLKEVPQYVPKDSILWEFAD